VAERIKKLTDGRKPVTRSLPPIAEACAAFKGFTEGGSRSEQVFEVLSTVIQRSRRSVPQPFYAMRDVAAFFGVSLDTVAKVYRRLDREGVLTLVRSSQTTIAARSPRPRFALRGVVCMPLWLPGFLQFLDWRRCISLLEEELSHYRFVSEPIFYQAGEEVTPDFVDRVLKYNPDYVLWYCPGDSDTSTMRSIADAGVPLVVIQNSHGNFPGRIYRLSYQRALKQGLKEWATCGEIDDIVIPHRDGVISATEILRPALEACALPYRYELFRMKKSSLQDYLRRLAPNPRTGIIFDDDLFYARLCGRVPDLMIDLLTRRRTMVMRHLTIPCETAPREAKVDALLFPWKRLARRIATDLSKAKGLIPAEQAVLEAEWHSQIPLAEVAQFDWRE